MKSILTVLTFFILVVSGLGQTRNVVVGTNGAVVQPTNFWSADVTNARNGLGLGSAATNASSAFQPSSLVLSNISSSNAINLTNLQVSNISGTISLSQGGTGATNATNARIALGLGSAATNSSAAFQPSSLILSNLSSSNASGLTNISAASIVGTVAVASNITGTAPLATNVTGIVALANGGTAGTNEVSARASLGATVVGANLFTLPNPDEVRFLRLNANNTVSSLNVSDFRNALSIGTNSGTVTSVGLSVPNIFSLSTSTITSSGTFAITLGNQTSRHVFIAPNGGGVPAFRTLDSDDLPSLAISKISGLQTSLDGKLSTSGTAALATNITGIVAVANGGTGATNESTARVSLGATTIGANLFTLANPDEIRFLRLNANNTVSSLNAVDFRNALSIGTNVGTVTSVGMTVPSIFSLGTSTITSSGTFALGLSFQSSRQVFIAPNAGGTPAFRAIDSDDLPSLAISKINGLQTALDGKLSASGTAPLATNITGVVALANGGTGGTNEVSARTSLGATIVGANLFTLSNPDEVRFLRLNANNTVSSLNAVDFRNALSISTNLGTVTSVSMTVPNIFSLSTSTITSSGTFLLGLTNQSSRQVFIAPNGGGTPSFRAIDSDDLPSLAISKVTGLQTALDGKLSASGIAPLATNVTGIVALANGGTGTSNAASARTNLEMGLAALTNTNNANFRSDIGLGWSALTNTNTATSLLGLNDGNEVVSKAGANTITFLNPIAFSSISIEEIFSAYVNGGILILDGYGTNGLRFQNPSDAVYARTNLGLGLSALTNTNTSNFRSAIGLGWSALTNTNAATSLLGFTTNGQVVANTGTNILTFTGSVAMISLQLQNGSFVDEAQFAAPQYSDALFSFEEARLYQYGLNILQWYTNGSVAFGNAAATRTNLGLGWPALTNTNAATSLLGVTTNGQIVANTGTNLLKFTNPIYVGNMYVSETGLSSYGGGLDFSQGVLYSGSGEWDIGGANFAYVGSINFNDNAAKGNTRTNLGLGATWLTNTNVTNFRSAIGLGLSALTNTSNANFRTNIELGWSALTNTNTSTSLLGYTTNNNVVSPTNLIFTNPIVLSGTADITSTNSRSISVGSYNIIQGTNTNSLSAGYNGTNYYNKFAFNSTTLVDFEPARTLFYVPLSFSTTANAATTLTNLGLGWSALTNTNAGTSLVSVNSNGTVVSPTNFWQVAPIQTLVQDLTVIVSSQTNTATNARNLYIYSMSTNVSGISNTILLPTNSATFAGDEATIIHSGTTNTLTVIRQAGATSNLIVISNYDESIKFIRQSGKWDFYHNISFVEPIKFSGTNTSNNAAETRTNLGIPLAALTNTNTTNFQVAIFQTNTSPTNAANFNTAVAWMEINIHTNGITNSYRIPLYK